MGVKRFTFESGSEVSPGWVGPGPNKLGDGTAGAWMIIRDMVLDSEHTEATVSIIHIRYTST